MIIGSISYKGGVGKSTLAQNLAVTLAAQNYKVCIVDADEAAATTRWFAIRQEREPVVNVVQMTDPKAIVPSVKTLYKDYDVVIIDGPPSLFPIVSKIMLLSHIIIIPVVPKGGSDFWVTEDFLVRYNEVQEEKDPGQQMARENRSPNPGNAEREQHAGHARDVQTGHLFQKRTQVGKERHVTAKGQQHGRHANLHLPPSKQPEHGPEARGLA